MLLVWSLDNALKSDASAGADLPPHSAPSQALFSGPLSSLNCASLGVVTTVEAVVGISCKDGVEPAAASTTCVSYLAEDPKTRGDMWLWVPGEESSVCAGAAMEESVLPSTAGQGSAGSGMARRCCFKQPLEAAVVLQ